MTPATIASQEDAAKATIDVSELVKRFSIFDYCVFGMLLLVSLGIGIFYGVFKKDRTTKTVEEYLLGGRNMGVLPTAMSLIASFMSAITLLGTPAEIYEHGTMYSLILVSYFLVMPATAYIYMPIFYDLGLVSANEYLERRFSYPVRVFGAVLFCIQMNIYTAIVVYAPSLALEQVTGINVHLSVCLIFIVCVTYTTLGGIKAVLWTDTIQMVIMFLSLVAIIVKGSLDTGGFSHVWETARQGGRIDFFNFDPNPGVRHTWWTLVIGGYFTWVTVFGVNQAQVQRYLCVPSKKKAEQALWVNLLGLSFLLVVCTYAGLIIYARYATCDPLESGSVTKDDQLFPLFVMDTMGDLPGVPGIFVSGIFSGALSTVSSAINSLAAVCLEDFIVPNAKKPISTERQETISRVLSLVFGILGFVLVFVAEQLGSVLQAALSIFGMIGGPLLGVYTLGMLCPTANAKGALAGLTTSLITVLWIGIGVQVEKARGHISTPPLPISLAGCPHVNASARMAEMTTTPAPSLLVNAHVSHPQDEVLGIYRLSYLYFSLVACLVVVVVGLIVSWFTGPQNPRKINPLLVVPIGDKLFCYLPKAWRETLNSHAGEEYAEEEEFDDFRDAESTVPPAISTHTYLSAHGSSVIFPQVRVSDKKTPSLFSVKA